ncbi:alpha/beta hydrolase family protein [Glaciecola petra]|uniref:Alpha/beta fold hydrolase n=1 Tax=Glaciecola petra TaxID=3075602 RepID=A0ABU2ZWJ8_9ALTE|nr:alpha/beta fold hydrolase [Aestuariibacter sp. P117]MDT0596393.1 alpha/beta fold hydrolase [Aestuariibacter sp. P117]
MIKKTLLTHDKTPISIREYKIEEPKASIILAGATGVPMHFYRHFSIAANEQGFNCYCLDYRGIGESAPKTLKGFEVDYLDWAKQDLAALVEYVSNEVSGQKTHDIFYVGHSYGGHALGLLPNTEKIKAAYFLGTGAGWSGYMPFVERLKVEILWKVLAPILVGTVGYMAWSKLGMGADLPKGVYQQWKCWCQYPRYFFDDPQCSDLEALFSLYKGPIVAANALDDLWAQPSSRQAFMSAYQNANVTSVDLSPNEYGLKDIGHIGYFSPKAESLWPTIFTFFDAH